MTGLAARVDALAAETAYSGVVSVTSGNDTIHRRAYGVAHQAHEIDNTIQTRFGLASGTKGLTALVIASLVETGVLSFETTARSLLGDDLPLIDDAVTIDHLLTHRSGIGDYLDEDTELDLDAYLLTVPAHQLDSTASYLTVLDGFPSKSSPGERFSYCNGGYVVLALLAERASGLRFGQLVQDLVCGPAGMTDTAFSRSDQLPARTATGYLQIDGVWRSNVFHLPVLGSGDGGVYSTVADVGAFWSALYAGRLVAPSLVTELVTTCSTLPDSDYAYGRGFWLHPKVATVELQGSDAGVSFRSIHDPARDLTCTVLSNTSDGAWPIARLLAGELNLT